jgi:hypothetical protein
VANNPSPFWGWTVTPTRGRCDCRIGLPATVTSHLAPRDNGRCFFAGHFGAGGAVVIGIRHAAVARVATANQADSTASPENVKEGRQTQRPESLSLRHRAQPIPSPSSPKKSKTGLPRPRENVRFGASTGRLNLSISRLLFLAKADATGPCRGPLWRAGLARVAQCPLTDTNSCLWTAGQVRLT